MKQAKLISSVSILLLAFPLYFLALTSCGENVTEATNDSTGMRQINKHSDLPKCTTETFGSIFYVSDSAKVFYCNEKEWQTLNGNDGKNGKDGQNGIDGKDGKDGINGKDGKDGKDGINGKDGISILYDSLSNYTMNNIDSNELKIVITNYGHTIDGLGECNSKRNNEVASKNSSYFICDNNIWRTAIPIEYDTYNWADTTDGAQKKGNVSSKLYVYDYNRWRAAIGVEKELGACVKENDFEVKKFNDSYYICKQRLWTTASMIEYDTYGKKCTKDATIESGVVHSFNKYVCDDGKFRFAKPLEVTANLGCTSYNDGYSWKIQNSNYICDKNSTLEGTSTDKNGDLILAVDSDSSGWSFDFGHLNTGRIVDSRDGEIYKTIGIKSQIWMAENLRFNSSKSKCIYSFTEDSCSCIKYGRLYTWDEAKKACPNGWHLPDTLDWWVLRKATNYSYNNLTEDHIDHSSHSNLYGFSAIRTYYGYRSDEFEYTYASDGITKIDSTIKNRTTIYTTQNKHFQYWSSTTEEIIWSPSPEKTPEKILLAFYFNLENFSSLDPEYDARSVRCVKD